MSDFEIDIIGGTSVGKTLLISKNENIADIEDNLFQTNGVEVETDTYRNTNISFRDIGSQMIPLWDSYLPKAKKIIYVIDSSSKAGLPESVVLLSELLINPAYQEIPIIIVLNKCDQEASINTSLFKNFLPVDSLRENIKIMECSALKGTNVRELLNWVII